VSQRASTFLLIAPPGGGKTHFCLEKIRETAAQAPFSPVWVIVRDRLQAAGYRGLLQQRGLGLGVEVATFGDLYEEALARAGGGILAADEPSLHALVQSVVDEAAAAGALRHFSRISAAPGFAAALRERFAELKRALVWPEQLAVLAQRQPEPANAALGELAYLYAAYQRRLQEVNWADREGITWMGLDALRADPGLLGEIRLVLVDGFDSFNPARRQTLKALAGRVGELWITLPGEPEMRRPAHRRFARALRDLQADLPLEIVSLPRGSANAGPFAALEPRLFEPPGPAALPVEQVTLLEAQSPDEEAREALRWIKARIVRDGFSPSDCALIVPDFATYRAALLAAAAEFGLPLRLTHAARLIDTPPITALLDLLYLPLRSYPLRLLLDTVRAPFFDLSSVELRREDARLLEIVSRYGQIFEGLALWHEVLGELAGEGRPESAEVVLSTDDSSSADSTTSVEDLEEGQPVPALPEGETAARLDRGLQALGALVTPPRGEQPVEEWVRWLAGVLEAVRFMQNCALPVERQWMDSLRGLLTALAHSGRLAGRRLRSYGGFLSDLRSLLAGTPAEDDLPAAEESILVLHTFEARGLRFKAAALVGLAEGLFPSIEREDPFLSEAVRAALGMDLQLGQDQAGIFYQLVARADSRLLLTRPYLAKDGEIWEPSPFWLAVQEAAGNTVARVRPEDHRPLSEAASPEELVFWAARRAALTGQPLESLLPGAYAERCQRLRHAHRVLAERVSRPPEGALHEGDLTVLAGELRERFGPGAVWSASRLEGYAACPFSFLVSAALGLELIRPPKAGFETYQLGSLLHEVLEQVYSRCPDPQNVESVLALLPEVAERVFEAAPRKYAFRPTLLWEVQKAELLETLRAAVTGLAELDAEAGWQPAEFECRFGIGGAPFLEIPVNGQPVRLRGLIDRIDRDRHGSLRVIDYKSGSSHLSARDLIEGRRLQLPLYALAAEQALGIGRVAEGLYWQLFAGKPGPLRLSRFECDLGQGPEAAYDLAVRHIERLVSGIRSGDFAPQPPEGGCPSYCHASSWCWAFRPGAVF